VQTMLADGYANGRPAARVAGDIIAWLAETEEEAEEALEAAGMGAKLGKILYLSNSNPVLAAAGGLVGVAVAWCDQPGRWWPSLHQLCQQRHLQ